MASELEAIQARSSPPAVGVATAAALRLLIGKAFAEPSHPAQRSAAFDAFANRRGEAPEAIVEDLVKRRMLRRAADGELSLSTLGCNTLERALVPPAGETTVHARLAPGAIAALLDVKLRAAKG
jgi:hypothetical protein